MNGLSLAHEPAKKNNLLTATVYPLSSIRNQTSSVISLEHEVHTCLARELLEEAARTTVSGHPDVLAFPAVREFMRSKISI
jgi:hypothetical protein